MHSGAIFSLKCVTYDRKRLDRCGHVLFIEQGKLVWGDDQSKKTKKRPLAERAMTALEKELSGMTDDKRKRNPNHKEHFTRNVRQYVGEFPTADIRKIHVRLIIEFNGQPTTP